MQRPQEKKQEDRAELERVVHLPSHWSFPPSFPWGTVTQPLLPACLIHTCAQAHMEPYTHKTAHGFSDTLTQKGE